jgi:hypothetical protein
VFQQSPGIRGKAGVGRQLSQKALAAMNGGEEVTCGLVVAGCDGAELLEIGEEILDQAALTVELEITLAG